MILAGVLPERPPSGIEICPGCNGSGEVLVERLFGRNAPAPYVSRDCGACGGEGSVPAEWVDHCEQPDCGRPFWRGEGCDHHGATVCPDCKLPNCHDCADARRDAS